MSDNNESTFPKGIFLKPPHSGAPSWVKGQIGIKVDEAVEYLQAMKNDRGYVNLDLKESKGRKLYLDLNSYESQGQPAATQPASEENDPF